MSNTIDRTNVMEQAIVIDGLAASATGWSDRLQLGGVSAVVKRVTWPLDDIRQALVRVQEAKRAVEKDDRLQIIRSVDDLRKCKKDSRVGLILATANSLMLGVETAHIKVLQEVGVRIINLGFFHRNLIADGSRESTDAGLSRFGRKAIQVMNEVGVQVDLNYIGERSSLEAMEASSKPCIFSAGNPRATTVEDAQQMGLSDDQIRACADQGGVVGISSIAILAQSRPGVSPTVDDVVHHMEYIAELVGPEHVGVATDSEVVLGSYPLEMALAESELLSGGELAAPTDPADPKYAEMAAILQSGDWGVEGFESMAKFPSLVKKMAERGWSQGDIVNVLGGNFIRVFEANW